MLKLVVFSLVILVLVNSNEAFFLSPLTWLTKTLLPTIHIIKNLSGSTNHKVVNVDSNIFYFLHKCDSRGPIKFNINDIHSYGINTNLDLKIIVPGWYSDGTICKQLIDSYIRRRDCHVLYVDWSYFNNVNYVKAKSNIKFCSLHIAKLLVDISIQLEYSIDKFHMVGFSMGAHLSGCIGSELFRLSKKKFRRITALDPLNPMFETPALVDESERLDRDDAEFVDCIHTNVGIFGFTGPLGHVDIYMNNGRRQPGCAHVEPNELNLNVFVRDLTCSHWKSVFYYADSIRSDKYKAVKCPTYEDFKLGLCDSNDNIRFGDRISRKVRGVYYCETFSL